MLVVLQAEEQRVLHKQQLEQEERLAEVRSQCPQLWLLHDLFCLVCFCTAPGRQDSTWMGHRYDVVIVFMNRNQKSRLHNLSTYHAHIHARHPGFVQSPPPPTPLEPFWMREAPQWPPWCWCWKYSKNNARRCAAPTTNYCITQNFQCDLNLGKQAQKTFQCYLILGVREVVRSTLRSFCTVLRTNESILRILGVSINYVSAGSTEFTKI